MLQQVYCCYFWIQLSWTPSTALQCALIVKGVYHVMVSTVELLQGTDSKLLSSDQFCSSSHNGGRYD